MEGSLGIHVNVILATQEQKHIRHGKMLSKRGTGGHKMSKAVLIMDMPECCGRCQLMDDDAVGGYCNACNDDYIDIPDTMGGKPDWCPLRELPERKDYSAVSDRNPLKTWGEGFNACLDTITGEA